MIIACIVCFALGWILGWMASWQGNKWALRRQIKRDGAYKTIKNVLGLTGFRQ